MTDLKINQDAYDLELVDGDFSLTQTESESLKQRLIIKLRTFRGEWYLDTQLGLPYFQRIFQKGTAKETVDSLFKQAILSEPEVQQLLEFSSSIDRQFRIYTLNFIVKSSNADEPIPVEIEL